MKKTFLFWLVLMTIVVVAAWVILNGSPSTYKKGAFSTADLAVRSAMTLYKKRSAEGLDMFSGPCLTNDLLPGWVVDIVHTPRDQTDDLPENQCQAYAEGRATHFVELDTSGNLVRIK